MGNVCVTAHLNTGNVKIQEVFPMFITIPQPLEFTDHFFPFGFVLIDPDVLRERGWHVSLRLFLSGC